MNTGTVRVLRQTYKLLPHYIFHFPGSLAACTHRAIVCDARDTASVI